MHRTLFLYFPVWAVLTDLDLCEVLFSYSTTNLSHAHDDADLLHESRNTFAGKPTISVARIEDLPLNDTLCSRSGMPSPFP
jgi:hypothetical protein